MRRIAVVERELEGGLCEVRVECAAACGRQCASCVRAVVTADNRVGARAGDRCAVDTPEGAAALMYLLPAALGVVLGTVAELLWEGLAPAGVAAGLVIGLGCAALRYRLRRGEPVRIVAALERAAESGEDMSRATASCANNQANL